MTAGAQDFISVPGDMSLQAAISAVSDGGIIEVTSNLNAPMGGWNIYNINKSMTICSSEGNQFVLSGSGTTKILRSQNSSLSVAGSVVFENLDFSSGYNTAEGQAGGITLYKAYATFVGCGFSGNDSDATTTVGGAIYVADQSTVFFVNCVWSSNTATAGGAGLGIRSDSKVFVHASLFLDNATTTEFTGGGGINLGNASLRVTDTRFEGNQINGFGGALYAIGNWLEPYAVPRAHVVVANCTFVDNHAATASTVFITEGGAINIEDQTLLEVYGSRFVNNTAEVGGGVNLYRSTCVISNSVFLGNQATDTVLGSGFGGAIKANSDDGPLDGTNNRPSAHLTVTDTYIQGRYGATTTAAQDAGGIYSAGDGSRMDGDPTVPDMGTNEENQATVILSNVIINDCDVSKAAPSSGSGGGLMVVRTNLEVENSLFVGCDALGLGDWSSGGAVAVLLRSTASFNDTTFAANTSQRIGGAVFAQGSTLNLTSCNLVANEVSPGVTESLGESFGAALFTAPDTSYGVAVDGVVTGCTFSGNIGLPIVDDDRDAGPINDVRYNANTIHSTSFGDLVYRDALTAAQSATGLNSLTVQRGGAADTVKSQSNNTQPATAPIVGTLLAAPMLSYQTAPPNDAAPPSPSYLGYGWSGQAATLDSAPLAENGGAIAALAGMHELDVNGSIFGATISTAATPTVDVYAQPSSIPVSGTSMLYWTTVAGTFLDCGIDQGVDMTPAASGSAEVLASLSRTFTLVSTTEQGGAVGSATVLVGVDPNEIFSDSFESGDTSQWSVTN